MNTALKARLKQSKKNTLVGRRLARQTKKYRKNNYHTKPRSL